MCRGLIREDWIKARRRMAEPACRGNARAGVVRVPNGVDEWFCWQAARDRTWEAAVYGAIDIDYSIFCAPSTVLCSLPRLGPRELRSRHASARPRSRWACARFHLSWYTRLTSSWTPSGIFCKMLKSIQSHASMASFPDSPRMPPFSSKISA